MNTYKLYQVDSFTKEKFRGNPAGVVLNADGLTDEQMQIIAREMNCSEAAFILSPTGKDHDVWMRYFTPTTEIPLCGHATIAAHYIRAQENKLQSSTVLTKTGVGTLQVDIIQEENDYKIIFALGDIKFGHSLKDNDLDQLVKALGIKKSDLDPRCPVQFVSSGHTRFMVGINKKTILNNLAPDLSALAAFSKKHNSQAYFLFTFDTGKKEILTTSRMFAPALGINEDPVTGDGNGPLGAYLVHNKLVKTDSKLFKFTGMQGEAIGRTGFVDVTITIKNGEPNKVRVGGNAVIVFQTTMEI